MYGSWPKINSAKWTSSLEVVRILRGKDGVTSNLVVKHTKQTSYFALKDICDIHLLKIDSKQRKSIWITQLDSAWNSDNSAK